MPSGYYPITSPRAARHGENHPGAHRVRVARERGRLRNAPPAAGSAAGTHRQFAGPCCRCLFRVEGTHSPFAPSAPTLRRGVSRGRHEERARLSPQSSPSSVSHESQFRRSASPALNSYCCRLALDRGGTAWLYSSALSPGGPGEVAPPVPIPNTEVKRLSADDTALARVWENRSPPGDFCVPGAFPGPSRSQGHNPCRISGSARACDTMKSSEILGFARAQVRFRAVARPSGREFLADAGPAPSTAFTPYDTRAYNLGVRKIG